jgi:hypothetical protein
MCINNFIEDYSGTFAIGRWIPLPLDVESVQYHRSDLDAGYAPPVIIVDVIKYLVDNGLWMDWMKQFDRILITRKYMDGLT